MIKMLDSFKYAILGIIYCIKTQRNMRIHCGAALSILIIAFVLELSRLEIAVLCITITLVLIAEMINTAIESTIDLYSKNYHPLAKIAKDVAAGAVLVTAINALIVGLLIFYKYSDKIKAILVRY